MSFRDWLPITTRNRVALGLAAAALPLFVLWNCLPHYKYEYGVATAPDGIVAMTLWPEIVFSPDSYLMVFKEPNMEGFLVVASFMAMIESALVTLAAMPFWKRLHASPYIRLPLAIVNLLGGAATLWLIIDASRHWVAPLILMALNMFALSAALFLFKNELALREERNRPAAD
jgi:hypothetical protein